MDSPQQLLSRVTELEIKLAYSEDQLDEINRTVYRQQQQIDQLGRELKAMREQLATNAPGEGFSLRDELPPHY